jgi:uncharacterized protein DUF2188
MTQTLNRYDLVKGSDGWELKSRGEAVAAYSTKAEALEKIPHRVRAGTVRIHKENGTIEEERTYPRSKDPRASPG